MRVRQLHVFQLAFVRRSAARALALIAIGLLVGCAEPDHWADIERDAGAGDANAQMRLGLRYRYGTGIPVDLEQARYWLALSAAQNYPSSQYHLAKIYFEQHDAAALATARVLLRAAHDGEEPMAGPLLAELLATSADGNREDGQFAVSLLEPTLRNDISADAQDFEVLAAAYARAGRFAEAVGAQRHAVSDEDCRCKKELLRQRERRLATYQRGETWNEAL